VVLEKVYWGQEGINIASVVKEYTTDNTDKNLNSSKHRVTEKLTSRQG
jgi:hypothetical protein